jgi:hypothetical protein
MGMREMHKLILFRGSIDHYIATMWKRKKLVEAPQDLKEDIANWVDENYGLGVFLLCLCNSRSFFYVWTKCNINVCIFRMFEHL